MLEYFGSPGSLSQAVGPAGGIVMSGSYNVFQRRTPPLARLSFPIRGVEKRKWNELPTELNTEQKPSGFKNETDRTK